LDKPKYAQYLRWLNKVSPIGFTTYNDNDPAVKAGRARAGDVALTRPRLKLPDLGDSFARGRPVMALIGEALPITLLLQAISLPLSYMLAIWLGIQQARRRGSAIDYTISGWTLALWSIPQIWVGVLLIGFLANDQYLHWFPTTGLNDLNEAAMTFLPRITEAGFEKGWLLDRLYHLILPIVTLTYVDFAFLSRLTRGALLDNLNADFVRTARAKGLPERIVLYQHAFRNSLIPLITVLVNLLPGLIAGSVVVENIFSISGMGKLAVDAAFQRDFELLLSITLVAAVLELIAYLLADLGYAVADPRVSYE
jgi:peptide/nickel transport system permease protein